MYIREAPHVSEQQLNKPPHLQIQSPILPRAPASRRLRRPQLARLSAPPPWRACGPVCLWGANKKYIAGVLFYLSAVPWSYSPPPSRGPIGAVYLFRGADRNETQESGKHDSVACDGQERPQPGKTSPADGVTAYPYTRLPRAATSCRRSSRSRQRPPHPPLTRTGAGYWTGNEPLQYSLCVQAWPAMSDQSQANLHRRMWSQ